MQRWVVSGLKSALSLKAAMAPVKAAPLNDHRARQPRISGRCLAPTDKEDPALFSALYPASAGAGEIVIFDRSWYNRAGVERVMGFAADEVEKFLEGADGGARMVESGIILLKYWLEVTPQEQERRLRDRIDDGRKIWKLSPMDIKSLTAGMSIPQAATPCLPPPIPPGRRGLSPVRKRKSACA
jgi:hypothetical protein